MALSSLRLASYNCRGFNVSKVPCISEILKLSDIILLQETWLFSSQFSLFSKYFDGYNSINVCGMDESIYNVGRPYGGCSILYSATIKGITPIILPDSKRICGIKYELNDLCLIIFNVYMPCDLNNDHCFYEYNNVLSEIAFYCTSNNIEYCIIGGDFNTDISRSRSRNTVSLNLFLQEECFMYCYNNPVCDVIHTYSGPNNSFSTIDHFIISSQLFSSIVSYRTVDIISNISDHLPLLLGMSGFTPVVLNNKDNEVTSHMSLPQWSRATDQNITCYKSRLNFYLHCIMIPYDVVLCSDLHCNNITHLSALELLYSSIIEACVKATKECIPHNGIHNSKPRHLPGWNDELDLARERSLFWHFLWDSCERPATGPVADVMRHTRNHYHHLIRKIKRDRDSSVRRSLGNSLRQNLSREYWTEVKKISKGKKSITIDVNGFSDASDIANSFAEQYSELYASVPSNPVQMTELFMRIKESISSACITLSDNNQHCHSINSAHVITVIKSLHAGKSDQIDKLYSDSFKHATDYFIHCITLIINCMLCHGFAPKSFLGANIIPIPKNIRHNLSDSSNYRAIALSSIFSKILDKIILKQQTEHLKTSDLQFGFKNKSSTVMCSTALIETVEYYVDSGSPVYVLLIDASKAFDRVCHATLFNILNDQNVCPTVTRLLFNMYSHSDMRVRWKNSLSTSFALQNGVKQGGVLSPILFSLYINGLLDRLRQSKLGCHVGMSYAGAFAYADDVALVSPTLYGLRKMINICELYAKEFCILFNPKKSKLLCFNILFHEKPCIKLCGKTVEVVDNELHLGNRVYNDVYKKNVDEMVSDFYRRSNHVMSNFRVCDSFTLNNLHSTYCTSFYGIELYNFNSEYIKRIHVAWRKCIRNVFRLPSRTHNYIVSHLGKCIITRLDRRLAKHIYNSLHTNNKVLQSIITSKILLSPNSIFSENIRYLMYKYKLGHLDWHVSLSHILNKINIVQNHAHVCICNTISELCKIRDGIIQCDIVNNLGHIQDIIDDICIN